MELPNQDAAFLLYDDISPSGDFLAILADGHGSDGYTVANAVVKGIREAMMHCPTTVTDDTFLRDIFAKVDDKILAQDLSKESGSTVILAFRHRQKLHVATTGDSEALVVRRNRVVFQAMKHKPDLPQERARIRSRGGVVWSPPNPSDSSRVMIHDMALAMSRSFGDRDGKQLGYLLVDPDIVHLPTHDLRNASFLVIASDGVMDHILPDDVTQELADAVERHELPATCQSIIQRASELWSLHTNGMYRDDMTMMVIVL